MSDVIKDLYEVIVSRRESADENSYTAYLFREGLDKILKKVGEESSETIIAAKSLEAALANSAYASAASWNGAASDDEAASGDAAASGDEVASGDAAASPGGLAEGCRADLTNEVADLMYHILVMLAERNVPWEDIEDILAERAGKAGNLKPRRQGGQSEAAPGK
jgi:phosphoribosyl-ATP pyrophosphohydrolase